MFSEALKWEHWPEMCKNVIIACDSMLNNINSRGLSNFKRVTSNHPGDTSKYIFSTVEKCLKRTSET